jgi:O-antigen/teichoic acid export membrane protein
MNLADKTIINILAKSAGTLLLLMSSIVMVRFLSKEDYGTFLQVMLISNTVIMFTYLGIPQSIYYYLHKATNKAVFIVRNIAISIFIGIVASICFFFLGPLIAQLLNNPLIENYTLLLVLLIFFRGPVSIREPILISRGHLLLNSINTVVDSIFFYVPVIIAALLGVSLGLLLKIMVFSSAFIFFCFILLMIWCVKGIKIDPNSVKENGESITLLQQLRYALPIGVSSYLGIIGTYIDQYIVSIFFTPQSFAVYSRGAMQIPILSSIQFTVNDIMMPYYVKDFQNGRIENFLERFHTGAEKVAKINYPVFVFFFISAPSLITLLYTEQYLDAVSIFRTYLFFLVINITAFSIIPRAVGKTKSIFWATTINVVANIILSCLLVPFFGPDGAAIATVFCGVINAVYYISVSARLLQVSFMHILPWGYLGKLLSVSFCAGIPVFITALIFESMELNIFLSVVVEAMIYLLLISSLFARFKLLNNDDFDTLSKWMKFDVKSLLNKIVLVK